MADLLSLRGGTAAMVDHSEHSQLKEVKEQIAEVVELLNQPNLPVAVSEEGEPEATDPGASSK
jgi:hypothetical protein